MNSATAPPLYPDVAASDKEHVVGYPPVNPVNPPPPHFPHANPWPVQPDLNYTPPNSGRWTTGLCGCGEDCSSCCCSCWCPCVVVGQTANILDRGVTSPFAAGAVFFLVQFLTGLGFLYSCLYRGKLRHKYGLPEAPCNDVCVDCCCLCCSLAQVYRELKNRGVDPALGYEVVGRIYDAPQQQHMAR